MASVAIVGPDGAGKTTIARMLQHRADVPVRYVYMGVNPESSNALLPTTALVHWLKERRERGRTPSSPSHGGGASGTPEPVVLPTKRLFPGLWAAARLVNRAAEEWYRQILSWCLQLRGYLVVYDRHFVYDFRGEDVAARNRTITRRLHVWMLERLFPTPDLVVVLDAPGEVLFARKGEKTPELLERRREALSRQAARDDRWVRVDATRTVDEVYRDVADVLTRLHRGVATVQGPESLRSPSCEPVAPGTRHEKES